MSFKTEIIKIAEATALTNKEIAKVVGCSTKTVLKYAGSFVKRSQSKAKLDKSLCEIKKSVLLPDIHYPCHDKKVIESVNEFIKDYNPDELIYMGDQLDLSCISNWNKKKPLLKEGKRLIDDYSNFDIDILREHERITKDDCNRIFIYGNHERRLQWFIEEHSELDGMLDLDRNLDLTKRGYKIIKYNGVYNIGNLRVIHGLYYNKYHAAKTLDAFEKNVVYGHVHNPQSYTKISPMDGEGHHTATSIGCLCNITPEYQEGKPNYWVNGFGIIESLSVIEHVNLYPITIVNGKFIWNGKLYGNN